MVEQHRRSTLAAAPLRVSVVEWPDGLRPAGEAWREIAAAITSSGPDILVTNELPFGPWLASAPAFDRAMAQASIDEHAIGLGSLADLDVPAIVSSRPVWEGDRLANEAVVIQGGTCRGVHRKQYFPAEEGWHEDRWFTTQDRDFRLARIGDISVGVLLCTEAMFNEHARAYGRDGAALIAIPRATGQTVSHWHLAARMAALVSGCYVVSSNRVGTASKSGPQFGGGGFAFSPDGDFLGTTSRENALLTIDLDPQRVAEARTRYPCYVPERGPRSSTAAHAQHRPGRE